MTQDINNNLLAGIIFSYEKTAEEKRTAATEALVFNPDQPEKNKNTLEELEVFVEYLQSEQERMALDVKDLTDSDVSSEVRDFYKRISAAVKEFDDSDKQSGDPQRLFAASRALVDLSEKFNSVALPYLAELGEHISILRDANRGINGIYGLLKDASVAASEKSAGGFFHKKGGRSEHLAKLKINTIDMNTQPRYRWERRRASWKSWRRIIVLRPAGRATLPGISLPVWLLLLTR